MRWNVVIGGQLMSKSHRGYTEFHPEWLDKEGIVAVLIVMCLPLILLFILGKIFPFWMEDEEEIPETIPPHQWGINVPDVPSPPDPEPDES